MDRLRREIDRMFEGIAPGLWSFPFSRFSFLPGRAARAYPLINLSEDADHIYLEALAPGVAPDSLKVSVVRDQLTLEGEKAPGAAKIEPEAFHRSERSAGKFIRTVGLPAEVDPAGIKAEYRNGLLTMTLPKAEAAKPRQVTVKVA
jgi:HSP20 family protein